MIHVILWHHQNFQLDPLSTAGAGWCTSGYKRTATTSSGQSRWITRHGALSTALGSPAGGQPPGAGADTWVSLPVQPQSAAVGFRSFCVPYSRAVWGWGRMARRLARDPGRGGAYRIPWRCRGGYMDEEMTDLLSFLGGSGATWPRSPHLFIDITVFC